MVMADDENSDFVANATEQKVIREPRKFALRISRSRIEKDCGLSAALVTKITKLGVKLLSEPSEVGSSRVS